MAATRNGNAPERQRGSLMGNNVNDAVHKLQLLLLEGIQNEQQLLTAGSLMSRSDYGDVVTERSIAHLCGYPLCPNPLPPSDSRPRKGRYRIDLKEHKVYDVREMYLYCSTECLVNSKAFSGSLQEERCSDLNSNKLDEILNLFDGFKIQENENVETKVREMIIGPSDAIEGYVPQPKSKSSLEKKGVNADPNKLKSKNDLFFSEMDFVSTIVTSDEYSISKTHSGLVETTSNSKLEEARGKESGKNLEDQFATLGSLAPMKKDSSTSSRESRRKSKTVAKDELGVPEVHSTSVPLQTGSSRGTTTAKAGKGTDVEIAVISSASMLKPSLKSSVSKKLGRSVTWADEKVDNSESRDLCEFSDMGNDDDDGMLRFASAEACAKALSQAAEVVASGDSDVADAVSEAGIVILPRPHDADEGESVEDVDTLEPDTAPSKWPSKPGIPRSDLFDPEDSWYDPPPEGFSLTLSPFATMWMAIFAWITSSSLAYIYGKGESFHEEYLSVNGREYPRKIVLADGRSSEIKQTLAGCLARALPGLVADLRLPTPVSSLEQAVGHLVDTMSFIDALPAFRTKQWQVIALLFIDALSVCRIPALSPHMTNRTMLHRKVLDGAQITAEEYEVMKDFIMPLGRVPHFSTQSGA